MSLKTVVFTFLIFQYGGCQKGPIQVEEYEPVPLNAGKIPYMYDWREYGEISPVKDQRQCNACWAFSIVANVESQYKIQFNLKETLSEQFLIDCMKINGGCQAEASIIDTISSIISDFGGILRDKDYYPYANRKMSCRWKRSDYRNLVVKNNTKNAIVEPVKLKRKRMTSYNGTKSNEIEKTSLHNGHQEVVPVIGFRRVKNDEKVMAEFIYKMGPLTAAINMASMSKYKNGIDEPTDEQCDPKNLNHSVLIVGYSAYVNPDTGEETPYWIIKNSWGSNWGDHGYYYLVRGRNACGIASDVTITFVN